MHFCSMFKKLQAKWKVSGWNLLLIISTFALGGSLCGYAGRKILGLSGLEKNVLWVILYIVLITLLWPLCVLLISIPLGQFSFFRKYIGKIWNRITGKKAVTGCTRIAIFASGAGSNAQKIIEYFKDSSRVRVELIVCNKPGAGVLNIAAANGIESMLVIKTADYGTAAFLAELKRRKIDLIVLAGFLLKIPVTLIKAYPRKIINIHPAILPGYGGKGMYGKYVHEAVVNNKDKQSGITIHFVDEVYDHGEIIFQATCDVDEHDTADSLAKKIHQLEHNYYPQVIESIL